MRMKRKKVPSVLVEGSRSLAMSWGWSDLNY